MPPCWANSLTSESHPGVRGSDILRSRGHEVRWSTSETLTWDGGRHRQRRGLWRSCHLDSGCTEWGCQSCSRHKGSLPPSHLRACWLTPKMSKFKIVLKQNPMMMILTTNGVSMIILMTLSVSGWILWSKLASCERLVSVSGNVGCNKITQTLRRWLFSSAPSYTTWFRSGKSLENVKDKNSSDVDKHSLSNLLRSTSFALFLPMR